jgi:hypothetical protein
MAGNISKKTNLRTIATKLWLFYDSVNEEKNLPLFCVNTE